ncbi:hypothetical protein HK099_007178 [Clydaea vesicula]|uniref:Uncharacterized protein n=1 Tax=Clydaea vesicula TaxID=447962 RepID=A0AAD5U1K8_9FUNG|nr:hypothetical protein HK099_007178 [Clydaea vesicula]
MWHPNIVTRFQHIDHNAQEKEYYIPYNALLNTIFKLEDGYFVAPQLYRIDGGKPIMFLEMKKTRDIHNISKRVDADEQMRERYTLLSKDVDIPILYGISAFGTRIAVYQFHKSSREVLPRELIPTDPSIVTDIAPIDGWKDDIIDEEGYNNFMIMVNEVKRMVIDTYSFQ